MSQDCCLGVCVCLCLCVCGREMAWAAKQHCKWKIIKRLAKSLKWEKKSCVKRWPIVRGRSAQPWSSGVSYRSGTNRAWKVNAWGLWCSELQPLQSNPSLIEKIKYCIQIFHIWKCLLLLVLLDLFQYTFSSSTGRFSSWIHFWRDTLNTSEIQDVLRATV